MEIEETTWIFLGATLALSAYAFLAVGFYIALHSRDPGSDWLDERLRKRNMDPERERRARLMWWYGLVPGVACLAGVVLAVLNVGIMIDREVEDIYAISAAIVAAVRILAYVWQPPAHLLAQVVPYAVLTATFFNTRSFDWSAWSEQLEEAGTENALSYVALLFLLEWGLRSLHNRRQRTAAPSVHDQPEAIVDAVSDRPSPT